MGPSAIPQDQSSDRTSCHRLWTTGLFLLRPVMAAQIFRPTSSSHSLICDKAWRLETGEGGIRKAVACPCYACFRVFVR